MPRATATATPRRRSRGPRPRLQHDQIVTTALAMLEDDGFDAFSMRRLAERLGVAPMTVYGYFPDQDALFDAVVDRFGEATRPPPPKGSWREQLRDLFLQLHRTLVRHPYIVRLRLGRQLISPGALRWTEQVYATLASAGFAVDDIPWIGRDFFFYTFGHAAFSAPADEFDHVRRESAATLAVLPPEEYPTIVAAGPAMLASVATGASFEHGLDLMLDGLEARLTSL